MNSCVSRIAQPASSGRRTRRGMRQSIASSEGFQECPLW